MLDGIGVGPGLRYVRYYPAADGTWTTHDPYAGTVDWDIQWHVDGRPVDAAVRPVLARMLQDTRLAGGRLLELDPPPHGAARIWVDSSMLRPLTRRAAVRAQIRGITRALGRLLPSRRP